ncbi:hypothetical protein RSP781_22130 [Ralstonia pseudosolanacearum]|nr:hypothetical protein RSP781_22130 [Ralstonia pseudosolanacearum]
MGRLRAGLGWADAAQPVRQHACRVPVQQVAQAVAVCQGGCDDVGQDGQWRMAWAQAARLLCQ